MYLITLGPRCFKWKMLSLLGPKASLFIQLLIALITGSAVNGRAISNGFLLVSLVTIQVSLEELVCPALNCWLNWVASCLEDENELPLKVIGSFSVLCFALPSILHRLVRSVSWSMVSTKSHFFRLCTQMRFWVYAFGGTVGEYCWIYNTL